MNNSPREIMIIVEMLLNPQEYFYMLINSKIADLVGWSGLFFSY